MTDDTWTDGEEGPKCCCGWPTRVSIVDGKPMLWCFGHSDEAGAWWPLPPEKPDNWPNLTGDEMESLIESADKERLY